MFDWDTALLLMGPRARYRRESRQVTQAAMATFLGCDIKTVARFENGERPGINSKTVFGYAFYFDEDYEKFYGISRGRDAKGKPYIKVQALCDAELSPLDEQRQKLAIKAASRFSNAE